MKLYLLSTFFLSILLITTVFLQGNTIDKTHSTDLNNYNFRHFQANECLRTTMGCGTVGTLHFSGSISNCQSALGQPFVWLEMNYPGACLYMSISNDDSFIIDSGSWGAKVQFLYNVSYYSTGIEQTWQFVKDLTCSYQHMLTCYN